MIDPMKQFTLLITGLLLAAAVHAEKSPRTKATKIATEGSVRFKFSNLTPAAAHKDSVLIIFDRCNHTGAGVIYQVYSADADQQIFIQGVPAGKYFVTIQGLGLHRDRVEKVVRVKARKNEKLNISLADSEEFSKDKVVIPASTVKFGDMAILRTK